MKKKDKQQRLLAGFDDAAPDDAVPDDAAPDDAAPDDAAPDDVDQGQSLPPSAASARPGPPTRSVARRGPPTSTAAVTSASTAASSGSLTDVSAEAPTDLASLAGKQVWVIDAHALIYQVFHAMPDMSGPAGQAVGAIHGFIRDVLDILEKKQPDILVCAFDHSDVTFRHDLFAGYKQSRPSMPEDLRPQIDGIVRLLDGLGIRRLDCPGFEADDVMATLARQVREAGGQCVLVTHDKDCRQLIGDQVKIYNIRKDLLLDAEALHQDWGIRPDQVIDFQALVGDSVDDVPGVPLIGPKLARELLEKYGTLDTVLEHAHEVAGTKRRENLVKYREQALLSRQLVKLADDAPVGTQWIAPSGTVDAPLVQQLCEEFGFRRLGDRLLKMTATEIGKAWTGDYQTVADLERLRAVVAEIQQQPRLVVDLETTSAHPRWADIVGYALAWREGHAVYVPVRAPDGEPCLDAAAVMQILRPLLEDPALRKLGQNIKYDMVVLRSHGTELRGIEFDTMVADYLLSPGERNHNLDDLARRYLRHDTIKTRELLGSGRQQRTMDQVPVADVTEYACEDADIPLRLHGLLRDRLAASELTALFDELEMPLIDVLAEMEFNGIRVDVPRLEQLSRGFTDRLGELESEIYQLAGEPFNIDSPKQLADVLFQRLGLPVVKKTRTTGASTDADVLEELASRHPLPAKIVQYRQLAKLKGTYVDALPQLVHPRTGRVHSSFKQDVAATGRLSSKDPNLQNIPIRTQEGREIRSAFLPAEGWQLLTADYSQIELRILAHFCGDAALQDAFARDEDVHTRVASEVFGVPLADVRSDMRRRAKAVNFGIIYGQTAFGLAQGLGIAKDEAAAFIEAYFARYPAVRQFIEKTLDACREKGYVSTILGRRRAVEGVRTASRRGDGRFRTLPERIAINTVIQGSAADLIKQAMINLHRRMREKRLQARMLLQIHDELVFEVPSHELTQLAQLVATEMTGAAALDTPLKVDVKSGANWAECDDVS
jgi:DNA polymerase I